MNQTNCPKSGRLFGGSCQFEARYDYDGPTDTLKEELSLKPHLSNADKEKLLERRTYVKDVCVKCGRSIPR